MTFGRAASIAGALALVAAVPAGASHHSLSPSALYSALLKAKVTTADLPHGYQSPAVGAYKLTSGDKKHHAVGGVEIVADAGNEAVIYLIFSSTSAAQLDWEHGNFTGRNTSAAPSSIAKPSVVINTSAQTTVNGKPTSFGLTDVGALRGNVIVQAATSSTTSTTHGDQAGAVALEQFALAHLQAIA